MREDDPAARITAPTFIALRSIIECVVRGYLLAPLIWCTAELLSEFGAGDGTRTRNFQLGKLTLYH